MYGVRECSNFILLHVALQFSQHNLLKRLFFSIVYSCLLCCRLINHKCVGLFLGFLFCSIDLLSVSVPVSYCFNYWSFVVWPEVRAHDSSISVLLSHDCFGYLSLLCFHTIFKIIYSSSVENAIGILIGFALNL